VTKRNLKISKNWIFKRKIQKMSKLNVAKLSLKSAILAYRLRIFRENFASDNFAIETCQNSQILQK